MFIDRVGVQEHVQQMLSNSEELMVPPVLRKLVEYFNDDAKAKVNKFTTTILTVLARGYLQDKRRQD